MSDGLIPYGRQHIGQADIHAVMEVLQSDWLTQGPGVPAFERAVAGRCGAGYAVAANSATSALHLACLALSVGPGDQVWTSPITFVASADCARYCGASVDFVDIDPHTWCLSAEALHHKLKRAKKTGTLLPKVVIPIHFAGQSCDMAAIAQLGDEYGFRIIEDASHAMGGRYDHEPVGNCRYSDISVFSLHPVKMITTGEGGLALTNTADLAERMTLLRSHGITRDPAKMSRKPDGPWYYEQIEMGFNYRMTDIQAALGLSQLKRLDDFVARRGELTRQYDVALADLPIQRQATPDNVTSARHLYVIRVPADQHATIFEHLREQGIGVNVHYIPVYFQPAYRQLGFREGACPESERYYSEALSLPIYPAMTHDQFCRVVEEVTQAVMVSAQASQ